MRRFILLFSVFGALFAPPLVGTAEAKPPQSWTAYRIARSEADGASAEERIQIWSRYLEQYPDSPYRDRVLMELDEATKELWESGGAQGSEVESESAERGTWGAEGAPSAEAEAAEFLGEEPPEAAEPEVEAVPEEEGEGEFTGKLPRRAGRISLFSTLGGVALGGMLLGAGLESGSSGAMSFGSLIMATAITVGPSAGHLYAGDRLHARRWSIARLLVGSSMGAVALLEGTGAISEGGAAGLMFIGGLTFTGLVAVDLVDSYYVVQRQEKYYRGTSLSVAPTLTPTADGDAQIGLSLSGIF